MIQPLFTLGHDLLTLLSPPVFEGDGELLGVPLDDDIEVLERAITANVVTKKKSLEADDRITVLGHFPEMLGGLYWAKGTQGSETGCAQFNVCGGGAAVLAVPEESVLGHCAI